MGALANTTPPPDTGGDWTPSFGTGLISWIAEKLHIRTGVVIVPFGQFKDQNPFTEFEDPSYPDGGPYKGESLAEYHRRKWDELNPSIRRVAVETLQMVVSVEMAQEARKLIEADPDEWAIEFHHFAGTWIRNELRRAVFDHQLPTGNWDDYYVMAFEEAIGGGA